MHHNRFDFSHNSTYLSLMTIVKELVDEFYQKRLVIQDHKNIYRNQQQYSQTIAYRDNGVAYECAVYSNQFMLRFSNPGMNKRWFDV